MYSSIAESSRTPHPGRTLTYARIFSTHRSNPTPSRLNLGIHDTFRKQGVTTFLGVMLGRQRLEREDARDEVALEEILVIARENSGS